MIGELDLPINGTPRAWAWSAALAVAAFGGTLATACMMPFVALATILALTVRPVQAVIAMTGIWAGNQALGFGLLGYPFTGYALMWGMALLVGSLAALAVAGRMKAIAGTGPLGLGFCFLAAFAVFEGLLYAFAHVAGGLETFAPSIIARIGMNDAIWLVLLTGLNFALTRAAPRWFGAAAAVRLSA